MIFDFPNTALSVTGLTDYLKLLLEQDEILRQVWVTGEVSSANYHQSGLFFTLKDTDSTASIKCVAWKSQVPKLAQMPVAGEQLIILGSIRIYPQRGEYQLTVWQALPAGVGLQALRYQQLKNRLQAEGLFDIERKKYIPPHPQIIAVVTSPTAAAWGDIQKTLKHRYPGLHILFSPATVQGEQAPASIVKAIERVKKDGRAEVLILSRGGGAVEELACFNDERVVMAVANCPIPIITGIGHQRDESLTDLVADSWVHTPTAAAETVVPSLSDLQIQHQQRIIGLCTAVNSSLAAREKQLQGLKHRLRQLRLDRQVEQERDKLSWQQRQLLQVTTGKLQQASQHLEMLRQKLAIIDPQSVLQRGYAVVITENGVIPRSVSELTIGENLVIQLAQGKVTVKVIEVTEG
ncbi:exodeoxyribonuclease VII large subunit [Dolichospermum sp. LEGE 00240]|uniref:exodeoxyribonuclease VII large subunit n=1 Tax=Dolichospermum sp. LEGE 00240 TaxID=1828603 RepID=UPI00187F6C0F|nr:exodeoxyribonuclease VII large subunit [Dolichospermum sp. LEGE 00240]MBE9249645.1 exodeoxyribonuclease VII large subunit [Dolichospermum sp. LEGE 00240]MDM3850728.1 exodeoxyribonuclease VII large subunit [Aphanizomenon gracile PMC627.10]